MPLRSPVPILYVTDIEKTIRFYCDVLGFRCANRFESWASLQRDSAEIMFSLPNEHLPFEKSLFTGSFYFHADDVDALWAQLRDKADVVYPLESFEYGMREFAIRDINGYLLQFGQEIQSP
jgi:catechol 2,3-dioxygenase-like lactoylglutathione lyase family enzyme